MKIGDGAMVWLILIAMAAVGLGGLIYTRQLVRKRHSRREPVPHAGRARGAAAWGGFSSVLFLGIVAGTGATNHSGVQPGHSLLLIIAAALVLGVIVALGVYSLCFVAESCGYRLSRQLTEHWRLGQKLKDDQSEPA